jgi:hypothetical protein
MADKDLEVEETEAGLRELLFAREPSLMDGVEEERQLLYRRLVRSSQTTAIKNAMPILVGIIGHDAVGELLTRYLDDHPPQTRLYRELPMEFRDWAMEQEDLGHPAITELINWEVTELEVLYAEDAEPGDMPRQPLPGSRVEFHPSARMFAFLHPVHTLKRGATAWPKPRTEPVFLLAHRTGENMHWVTLPTAAAKMLALAGEGAVVAAVFETLSAEHGEEFDEHFARSWLVNLQHRGAILGFPEV